MLETYVAQNVIAIRNWMSHRWTTKYDNLTETSDDWWIIKSSRGNGGRDIWIVNCLNYNEVLLDIPGQGQGDFVVQKYDNCWDTYSFSTLFFKVYN